MTVGVIPVLTALAKAVTIDPTSTVHFKNRRLTGTCLTAAPLAAAPLAAALLKSIAMVGLETEPAGAGAPPPAKAADDVPIRLVSGVSDPALLGADGTELTVPARMGRKALRDLLHHLLGLPDGGPDFHFLAPGGVALRTTLAKFISRRALSTEAALVLTYYLPLPAPDRPGGVRASDDWLADVAVWRGGAAPVLLAASYAGCPVVSTPAGVVVSEEDVRADRHDAPVKGVAWLADGRAFVTASQDETVRLWSYKHGDGEGETCSAEVCGVFQSDDVSNATAFECAAATSRGGKDLVALGATDGTLWVLEDLADARAAAADAAAAEGGKRKAVDVAALTARQVGTTAADLTVTTVRWRDGDVLTAGLDGMVRVWDADASRVALSVPGGGKSLTGLTHSEQVFLVSAADGFVRLLDARDGKGVVGSSGRSKGHVGMSTDVTWIVPDGSFASCGLDGSVRAWDMRAIDSPVHVVDEVHGKGGRALSIECCPSEGRTTVFSAGQDGVLQSVAFRM